MKTVHVKELVTMSHVMVNGELVATFDTKGIALDLLSGLREQIRGNGGKLSGNLSSGYTGDADLVVTSGAYIVPRTLEIINLSNGRNVPDKEIAAWRILTDGVQNLLDVWEQATIGEIDHGLSWYFDAHADAVKLAKKHNASLMVVCHVIAALSPSMAWVKNVESADVTFQVARGELSWDTVSIPAYDGNRDKATEIAKTGDLSLLSGDKVNSFAANIFDPTSLCKVTIDRHAIQAWMGRYEGLALQVSTKAYGLIEADYRKAAAIVGVRPHEFQAVVWVAWRRLNGLKGDIVSMVGDE